MPDFSSIKICGTVIFVIVSIFGLLLWHYSAISDIKRKRELEKAEADSDDNIL